MRTRIFFVSLAALAVACSDHDQVTSPAASARVPSPVAGNAAVSQTSVTPQAKPVDQVGFTKVFFYTGDVVTINAGDSGTALATCPAGSVLTGGGYEAIINGTPPVIYKSRPVGAGDATGETWKVVLDNAQAGAVPVKIWVWVGCAS